MAVEVDLFALLITGLIVVIAAFLIPMMYQVRKTSQQVDEFLDSAQQELLPLIRELREASERVNRMSAEAEKDLEKAGVLFDSCAEIGHSIHKVTDYVQHDVGRYAGNALGLWLGMRAASKSFLKQLKKRGGK